MFVQAGGGGASSTEPLSVGGACGGSESQLLYTARAFCLQETTSFVPGKDCGGGRRAKGCGGADDISEPLPCVDYAQAKPTEVDVGKQEKELAGMQVCEPLWSVML